MDLESGNKISKDITEHSGFDLETRRAEAKKYRAELVGILKQARKYNKEHAKEILSLAKNTAEYWSAWSRISGDRTKKLQWDKLMKLDVNPNDQEHFQDEIEAVAQEIYGWYQLAGRKYDPYEGDMLCGDISKSLMKYYEKKGIVAELISRYYEIKDTNDNYDDSFGHVFTIIRGSRENILVDATYLQWIPKEDRKGLPPVLVIRFTNKEDLKNKFLEQFDGLPIAEGMVLPFYIGFDAEETKSFFNDTEYTVLSNDSARIDA